MKNFNRQFPGIKHICFAAEHDTKNFCDFMKDIKSDTIKFNRLADILTGKIITLKNDIDLIISVPKSKEEIRDTDYSLKIAEMISEKTNIPYLKDALVKTKKTRKLKTLPVALRQKEIENAFEIKNFEGLKNKKVCIADDVLSSGSTIKEIIKLLTSVTDPKNVSIAVLVVQHS